MLCRELNRGKCKTYLVACERTRKAALIDPVRDKVERYLAMLAYFEHRTQQNDRRAVGMTSQVLRYLASTSRNHDLSATATG